MSAAFIAATALRYGQFRKLNQVSKPRKPASGFPASRRHRFRVRALADKPEDLIQRLTRLVAESYQELEPGQQLYVQVLYITLVVTIMLSLSATIVRLYNTFRMAGSMGW